MLRWLLAALQVAPMLALPLAHHENWKGKQSNPKVEVLDFGQSYSTTIVEPALMLPIDFPGGYASFAVGPGLSTELTSPLVSPRHLVRGNPWHILAQG